MMDCGPRKLLYSVYPKVFIESESPDAPAGCIRHSPKDAVFSKYSFLNFELMSVSYMRKSVDASLSCESRKLTVQHFIVKENQLTVCGLIVFQSHGISSK
ncbi:hypothetical protein AVEN_64738-1 [Araneus ventricosus]|uniref:Uncharacterized protein n=1 Tax=Araneus ventricosus TaxID=182803 RepID=A0A4Y2UFF6_ARAVE|nr:hypothetical protein AVEN_64738-1 [Araneus ventricosus]